MQLHQLKPIHRLKSAKRIGRGGKKGTYSGKGMKGQNSRSGHKPRPGFAGGDTPLVRRLPKKRGVVGKINKKRGMKLSRKIKPTTVSLKDIEKKFKSNEVVSPKSLLAKGLISKIRKRVPSVKILGQGQSKKELVFKGVGLSRKDQTKDQTKI